MMSAFRKAGEDLSEVPGYGLIERYCLAAELSDEFVKDLAETIMDMRYTCNCVYHWAII
jgi:hypothetical protein